MDITKAKAAVENVRKEIKALFDGAVASKDMRQLNGVQALGRAEGKLDDVVEKLEDAVKRSSPKKAKEEKTKKAAK